jgi:cysteine synthase A
MFKKNILESIGNTPLVELENIKKKFGLTFDVFAKLERDNPSGSVKDRAAYRIIKDALEDGRIDKESTIIEATSGNTGISLAMIAAHLHMRCVLFMPASASKERVLMMKAYGAEINLTEPKLGMKGSVQAAEDFHAKTANSFIASQFDNASNVKAHYLTTSKEVLADLDGKLDVFIAGFGTGGTLTGCAKRFKETDKKIETIGVEPAKSPLITEGKPGPHKIQGIGANFVPSILDMSYVDRVIDIADEVAYEGTRLLAKEEGILAGISSGAALEAALTLDKEKYAGKRVVIILPDNGERYLSVEGLYE